MKRKPIMFVVLSIFILGCGVIFPAMRQPFQMFERGTDDLSSNGASIYHTGRTIDGSRVRYTGGPIEGMMMGQRLSCAGCHGDDGSGGIHVMHMNVMDAPDIRLSALGDESHNHDDGEANHDDPHKENYDLHTFERAVVYGEHPDGESLSDEMPRWQLDDQNLVDLFSFISSLE